MAEEFSLTVTTLLGMKRFFASFSLHSGARRYVPNR